MIQASDELKILGFVFHATKGILSHIDNMKKKFNNSLRSIRHLKSFIIKSYMSMMPPFLEYGCYVFGPMLGATQINRLEECQLRALVIFGYNFEYQELLAKSDFTNLSERREVLFKKKLQSRCRNQNVSRRNGFQ